MSRRALRWSRLDAPDAVSRAALKLYDNVAFADTDANRRWIDAFAGELARALPVVAAVTEQPVDGHSDLVPSNVAVQRVDVRASLAHHSEILGTARVAITTYGGMAYVPMLYGVPTLALRADDGDNPVHLAVAELAARALATPFRVLDIRGTTPAAAAAAALALADAR